MKWLVGIFTFFLFISLCASQNYTIEGAERFLMYSYSAYCDPFALTSWKCFWCDYIADVPPIKVISLFHNSSYNTLGYAGVSSDSIVFSFRGTEMDSLENWITDIFNEVMIPGGFPNASVGKGFYTTYLGIQDQVITTAQYLRAKYPDLPFVFTGHSLGAVLTTFAAVDVYTALNLSSSMVSGWTFGSPRVGNLNFANNVAKVFNESWRTVNQDDLVPHLPPAFLGYSHVSTEIWFPNSSLVFQVCSSGEDPTGCADSVSYYDLSVLDHLNYLGYDLSLGEGHNCH